MTMNPQAQAVFDFWFQAADAPRREWFQKNEAFDREIADRFGRFPHRNAILGRASTPEEQAYLQQPGSGF